MPSEFSKVEAALAGWPNIALTTALVTVSLFGIGVALFGPTTLKVVVLAYFVLP